MKKGLLVINSLLAITLLAGCRGRGREGNSGSTSGNDNSNSSGQVSNSASVSNSGSAVSNSSSKSKANTTILIYMCGSNLESDYADQNQGLASGDISEILSVNGQPSDVNIVIETGGSQKWSSTHGINSNKLGRYHIENKKLVKDSELAKANMGLTSTFQSFLEYGLTNFPAEKTGVILWNHGGAMSGACADENYNDDALLNGEVKAALSGAFSKLNRTEKLEWIGYDCCLMQVQDVAETNSQYFNYMVASQESESGYGWDYDNWVDDLYAKKSTEQILTTIVDSFIEDNGGPNISSYEEDGETYDADQTLSWLKLSNMSSYKTAFENLATQLKNKITSSNKSNWNSLVKSAKCFGGDGYYSTFGVVDVKDFVNKLAANNTFKPDVTYTNAVLTALNNLVGYSVAQRGAGNAYGLSLYYDFDGEADHSTYYASSETNFTNWKYIVDTYCDSSGGWGGWGGYGGY